MRLLQELHLSGTGHILSHEGAKATFSAKCKLRKESTKNVKNGEKCTKHSNIFKHISEGE